MKVSLKRDVLIKEAVELFNKYGFHAVGVDTIIQKAKVSKKTLYRHFSSKNELILAVIRYYDETFRNFLFREIEKRANTPYDKLLSIFDVAKDWFDDHNFHGCIAIKAVSEFSQIDNAIRRSCEEFKRLISEHVEKLAREANAKEPATLATEICLLLEGAIVMAQVRQDSKVAWEAKAMAKKFIDAQIEQKA